MNAQRLLLAIALVAGCISGAVYLAGMQRSPVVVAARDVELPRPLVADDLELRAVPPDALPAGAVTRVDEAIGRVPTAPLWRGQAVVARALADDAATFHAGLLLPLGMRAVALPVTATAAVGGSITPGARVDVIAVPVLGRAPAGRTTELLANGALVLDLRSESGAPFGIAATYRPGTVAPERLASVVIAIAPADELRFADRIATSTFVLAFTSAR